MIESDRIMLYNIYVKNCILPGRSISSITVLCGYLQANAIILNFTDIYKKFIGDDCNKQHTDLQE